MGRIALAAVTLAASCSATAQQAVADTAAQAPTTTSVPSQAPQLSPTPLPTAEPSPTVILAPTPTASAVRTPTSVPTATPSPTPEPTPDAAAEQAALVSAAVEVSEVIEAACPRDLGPQVQCSVAKLPMYIDDPRDPSQIEMLFAYVDNVDESVDDSAGESTDRRAADDLSDGGSPVLYLQGGPGVGAVNSATRFVGLPYDVIVFDQRGTGGSLPKLACPEVDELWVRERSADATQQLSDGEVLGAYDGCAQRLRSAGVDFNAFNTTAVAFDTEVLRQLLNTEPWTIWGVSYGTRVAQAIMRDHPSGVRAAVLDSVVPFEIDFFAEVPQNAVRSFTALTEACAKSECEAAHGDFFATVAELAADFDAVPRQVVANRPVSGEQFLFRVDGQRFIDMVFTQMYSTRQLTALPRQVARIDAGGLDELVYGYVQRRDPERVDLAVGLYYTTWCREEFPFHDPVAAEEFFTSLPADFSNPLARSLGSDAVASLCDSFKVEPAMAIEDLGLRSDIRTLVFAGAFDPVTPPSWSRQVAERLENAIYVEMPNHGHGMATGCPVEIRAAFIAAPQGSLDVACAFDAGGPNFE